MYNHVLGESIMSLTTSDLQKNFPKFAAVFTTEHRLSKLWSSMQLRVVGTSYLSGGVKIQEALLAK